METTNVKTLSLIKIRYEKLNDTCWLHSYYSKDIIQTLTV